METEPVKQGSSDNEENKETVDMLEAGVEALEELLALLQNPNTSDKVRRVIAAGILDAHHTVRRIQGEQETDQS